MSGVQLAWLLGAIAAQVVGIGSLRASAGFRRTGFAVLTLLGIGASVALMARALDAGLPLAVGYGIWSGSGIALAALGGAAVFGDRMSRGQLAGVALIVAGVLVVHAGA
ncbi:multidrug efflux SMR transporter [Modestobacter sp. Leaf380]|uniref:DMT family transporter n=1 Tax=Modestobacter sp. Leaf380 TaxID=1736356 RepID=UPI0009EC9955|nr:SMR family transporter [Modestobacter sp. Leaf380]